MSEVNRAHNFNAGPSILPLSVLEQAQKELIDFKGTGMSVMEISHRSKEFEAVIGEAEQDLRKLMGIPSNYKVLFLQGGATLQFAMIPMNLRKPGTSADYIVTGSWSKSAMKEAQKLGQTSTSFTGEADNFNRLPRQAELKLDPAASYLYFTSNETIHGVEFDKEPEAPAGVPLFVDTSSDFISRPIDVSKYGLIYAGAQKNAGPSGVVVTIIRDDLLERVPANLPAMLDYNVQVAGGSMHNTPPCFAIYMVGLVFKWAINLGGLPEIQRRNEAKADVVYNAIDASGGFYKGHAEKNSRSKMNITFRLPTEDLENTFASEAKKLNMIGLKGHRSVGGMRASVYNALPLESAQALAGFMQEFQRKHG
ncbi:MAG: phosphoserine transaminase [Chloroflexota bacterium]